MRGHTFRTPLFSLRLTPTPPHTPPRFSVVVSKKTAKRSTDRHRLKRRIYAALEELLKTHAVSMNGVCYPTTLGMSAPFDVLQREFLKAFRL